MVFWYSDLLSSWSRLINRVMNLIKILYGVWGWSTQLNTDGRWPRCIKLFAPVLLSSPSPSCRRASLKIWIKKWLFWVRKYNCMVNVLTAYVKGFSSPADSWVAYRLSVQLLSLKSLTKKYCVQNPRLTGIIYWKSYFGWLPTNHSKFASGHMVDPD